MQLKCLYALVHPVERRLEAARRRLVRDLKHPRDPDRWIIKVFEMGNTRATGSSMEAAMSYCNLVRLLHLGIQTGSIIQHGASVMKSGF